jgi:hypothetical protein
MGNVKVGGELIFLEQIEGDDALRDQLQALTPGDIVELETGGVRGRWERIAGDSLRPIGGMLNAWTGMWAEPGGAVEIRAAATGDGNPATFGLRLVLWDTPESQIH